MKSKAILENLDGFRELNGVKDCPKFSNATH